jgi:hypothetical protein
MKNIEWENFVLKQDNAKKLKLDIEEPNEKDCVYIHCLMTFGGICNIEEIAQITEIVYQAYLREKENKDE